jgi:ClpP class serine protease
MSLHRIASVFYAEPWLVRLDFHRTMGSILQSHLKGRVNVGPMTVPTANKPQIPGCQIEDGYALVRVDGVIAKHMSNMERMCSDGYDINDLDNTIMQLQQHEDVHTVVISYNTPGGTATGVAESAGLIHELAQSKRVVSYIDSEACSAGYWLAAAAGEIYGGPTANCGSISCYIALLDETRAFEMEGLELKMFRDGDLKGIGMPGKMITDEESAFLQNRVDETGGRFKAAIRAFRPAVPDDAMRGQWFTCEQGMSNGLVDGCFPTLHHLLAHLMSGES